MSSGHCRGLLGHVQFGFGGENQCVPTVTTQQRQSICHFLFEHGSIEEKNWSSLCWLFETLAACTWCGSSSGCVISCVIASGISSLEGVALIFSIQWRIWLAIWYEPSGFLFCVLILTLRLTFLWWWVAKIMLRCEVSTCRSSTWKPRCTTRLAPYPNCRWRSNQLDFTALLSSPLPPQPPPSLTLPHPCAEAHLGQVQAGLLCYKHIIKFAWACLCGK